MMLDMHLEPEFATQPGNMGKVPDPWILALQSPLDPLYWRSPIWIYLQGSSQHVERCHKHVATEQMRHTPGNLSDAFIQIGGYSLLQRMISNRMSGVEARYGKTKLATPTLSCKY